MLLIVLYRVETEGAVLNFYYEAIITLTLKANEDTIRENYRRMSLVNKKM